MRSEGFHQSLFVLLLAEWRWASILPLCGTTNCSYVALCGLWCKQRSFQILVSCILMLFSLSSNCEQFYLNPVLLVEFNIECYIWYNCRWYVHKLFSSFAWILEKLLSSCCYGPKSWRLVFNVGKSYVAQWWMTHICRSGCYGFHWKPPPSSSVASYCHELLEYDDYYQSSSSSCYYCYCYYDYYIWGSGFQR